MKFKNNIAFMFTLACVVNAAAQKNVPIQSKTIVGEGIAMFVPAGFDKIKTPSLILENEPVSKGNTKSDWKLTPEFTMDNEKASATLKLAENVSLYGGGEVTGPLLRNGQSIKLWNTDTGAYSVEGGKRLYQSHPWVMGVRKDGTAFGILFDSSWKAELHTKSDAITFNTEGALFRIFIIDRKSPQDVLKGLAELTGTMKMPAKWTLGYHQCRFSYESETRVMEIADTFRAKNIPCDVIWMDIDYMDGFRVFTFDKNRFPNPKALNSNLHAKGFKAVYMIDPGVKADTEYGVYQSGSKNDVWVQRSNGKEYQGKVWPGMSSFPDFTMPKAKDWWAGLYKDFLATGIDGVWNDMNEPAIFEDDIPESERIGTMPYNNKHRGGGGLPAGSHLLYHNAYGRLMVEASYKGITEANPDKRPFLLTRSNLLGGQRYAATWTGDNYASWDHLKLSVPMSITLGLSGQPFNGPDIGGFLGDTSGELWANWISFGVFMPFARGHACAGTNNKEPWAYGIDIEKSSRIALERRYRLLPYLYTSFHNTSETGIPVMAPVFFADTKDAKLRGEEQAFLVGENLLVVPAFAKNPNLPSGIWEEFSIIDGDREDKYQAKVKLRGGSILPLGKVVQNTTEKSFDPLTLMVCLDAKGEAAGQLYIDGEDGFEYKKGDFGLLNFVAEKKGNKVVIKLKDKTGKRDISKDINKVNASVLINGKRYDASGNLKDGVTVSISK
jgi:alpha-glucosidase